jgi:type I restriction enzyme S subunit
MSFVTGSSGQSELDKVVLLDLKIDISSSQERIKNTSQLLEIIEGKIQNNRNLIQEIEKLIEELFNYWFLQFEFPNSDGKPYLSSGGKLKYCKRLKMEIPDEWISGVAEDLFIFNPNLSLKKGVEAPFIDMNALPLKGFNTKKPIQKNYNGGVKFQNGDVLIARITPSLENGKTALVNQLEEGVTAFGSTEFIVMRGRSIPLSHFASCLARSNHFRKFAIANMLGTSGRKRVDSDVLQTFSLAIPPRSTLHLFETTVSPMFEEMANKHQENDELIKIREWLIPQLIKGDTKV